jgi:hypothetical protein
MVNKDLIEDFGTLGNASQIASPLAENPTGINANSATNKALTPLSPLSNKINENALTVITSELPSKKVTSSQLEDFVEIFVYIYIKDMATLQNSDSFTLFKDKTVDSIIRQDFSKYIKGKVLFKLFLVIPKMLKNDQKPEAKTLIIVDTQKQKEAYEQAQEAGKVFLTSLKSIGEEFSIDFEQQTKNPFKDARYYTNRISNQSDFRVGPTYEAALYSEAAQTELIALVKDSIRKRGVLENNINLKNASFLADHLTIYLNSRTSGKSLRQGIYLNASYDEVIKQLKDAKPKKSTVPEKKKDNNEKTDDSEDNA